MPFSSQGQGKKLRTLIWIERGGPVGDCMMIDNIELEGTIDIWITNKSLQGHFDQ